MPRPITIARGNSAPEAPPVSAAFPPEDEGLALYRRLAAGEVDAPAAFARAYLDPLIAALVPKFPGGDPHLCEQAAIDTLFGLIEHPDRYDPGRGGLRGYLS